MTKVVTVAHLREDVGKTITAVQFAYHLCQKQRVLLLDLDIGGQRGAIRKFFDIEYTSPLLCGKTARTRSIVVHGRKGSEQSRFD